jgi:hypothetical protein
MGETETELRPTYIGLDPTSSICSTGLKNLYITGILLRILQSHFSRPENLTFNALKERIWKPETEDSSCENTSAADSGIQIESSTQWDPQEVQKRPGIFVKRNRVTTKRLGIDDGWTVGPAEGDYKTKMINGSHTCFCVAGTGAEAELIGQEVFDELLEFSPLIRRDFQFHRFTVSEITELNKLEESDEHYVVAVVSAWAHSQDWRIKEDAPWLKTLQIDLQPAPC